MTEKRYIVDVDEAIIDTKTNREYTTWDISGVEDICDKLNNLTEENEQLKSEKKDMQILINTISDQRNEFHRAVRENANRVGKLEKENEQLKSKNKGLKSELQIFKEDVTHSNLQINKLADENEQLKIHMKSAKAHLEGGHTKKAIERLKIIDIR